VQGNSTIQHQNIFSNLEAIMQFKNVSRGTSNILIMSFHLSIQKFGGASQPQTLVNNQGDGAGNSDGGKGGIQPRPHPVDPGTIMSPALSLQY
jgi:hypothetical protein